MTQEKGVHSYQPKQNKYSVQKTRTTYLPPFTFPFYFSKERSSLRSRQISLGPDLTLDCPPHTRSGFPRRSLPTNRGETWTLIVPIGSGSQEGRLSRRVTRRRVRASGSYVSLWKGESYSLEGFTPTPRDRPMCRGSHYPVEGLRCGVRPLTSDSLIFFYRSRR